MSAADPDVKRLRAALASLAGSGRGAANAERIFDALHGDLGAEERRAIVDRLVQEPDAAEAWRLARELAPAPLATAASGPRLTWRRLSIAAVFALAAGVGWQFSSMPRSAEEPAYRSAGQRAIASLLPDRALTRTNPLLRWTAVDDARYVVRVLTPGLDVLEEAGGLTRNEHRLSADTLRRIPPGGTIFWQVEARVAGSAPVVSPTFTVRVE